MATTTAADGQLNLDPDFAANLARALPRLLAEGALPDDWDPRAPTSDVTRFDSATHVAGRFARSLAPDDPALAAHLAHIDALRAAGAATVPLTLGVERRVNPVLNAGTPAAYGRRRRLKGAIRG